MDGPKKWKRYRLPGAPDGYKMLPWLLLGLGGLASLLRGDASNPWLGGAGLLTFNTLYIYVVFRSFDKRTRRSRSVLLALAGMAAVTYGLAIGYGGGWRLFFPLLALACGTVLPRKALGPAMLVLGASAGVIATWDGGDPWTAAAVGYGTALSGVVTSAILSLAETVRELRATREELAHAAVEKERLRFSRDLHDLLGHTLSVIVVKSEAARRLAPRDLDAALSQVSDIESVGRQALTEIREAVTGYREGSLTTELAGARSVLDAAGIKSLVRRTGSPLAPQTEALLGWVVREAVTNVVRHSGATRCGITVDSSPERVHLKITDNGRGVGSEQPVGRIGDNGLKGLTERLTAAGGTLDAGPSTHGGFLVSAELPVGTDLELEPTP
ncbi:sensor histidine kinase [Streptomyces sp. 21So2-11]|uniref:sensor histidine kinase n=1 Tax=Streptomyces sp. 21So2-11 TaxID=3144408 RepID=UPI003218E076